MGELEIQKGYTTVAQGKKLLELGVPINSADCYYYTEVDKWPKILTTDNFDWEQSSYIPCWSVGRLAQVYLKCVVMPGNSTIELTGEFGSDVISEMVDYMDGKYIRGVGKLDFTKWGTRNEVA